MKTLIFGMGVSARHLLQSGILSSEAGFDVFGVCDIAPDSDTFLGLPTYPQSAIDTLKYEAIIIASWAFDEISQRLIELSVPSDKLYWYKHHKSEIVRLAEVATESYYAPKEISDTLYAIYDLNVSRTTFDITGFLCLADIERQKLNLRWIHVVVANATGNDFNKQMKGIIDSEDHEWRKYQVLGQTIRLLRHLSGITFTSNRQELNWYCSHEHRFPDTYQVDEPVAAFEFDLLFEQLTKGQHIARLRAPAYALQLAQQRLKNLNPRNKKLVTISVRDTAIQPMRNSSIPDWLAFINALDSATYQVVVIPDTENLSMTDWQQYGAEVYPEACHSVELRMAMYELAWINLGVNNGPMHLCAMNPVCDYLMFKQVVEDYPHSSTQSFIKRGFSIGGDFPGATETQKFIWEDDKFDVIFQHFNELAEYKNKEFGKI